MGVRQIPEFFCDSCKKTLPTGTKVVLLTIDSTATYDETKHHLHFHQDCISLMTAIVFLNLIQEEGSLGSVRTEEIIIT